MKRSISTIVVLIGLIATNSASAGILGGLLRSGGRAAVRKGAQTTARQATKQVTSKTARSVVATTTRARAAQAARHLHGGAATVRSVAAYSDDLAKLSGSLSARNHRRLMMMAPELRKTGQTAAVVKRLAKAKKPNLLLDQIWKNRGSIAVGATATAVVLHGDDIAKAGSDIITASADSIAKPLIKKSLEKVAEPVATAFQYGLIALMALVGLFGALKLYWLWSLACKAAALLRNAFSRSTDRHALLAASNPSAMTES